MLGTGVAAAILLAIVPAVLTRTDPTEVVQSYLDAESARDWERVWDLSCDADQASADSKRDFLSTGPTRSDLYPHWQIAGPFQPYEPFPVEAWLVEVRTQGSTTPSRALVIREDGELRVCSDLGYLMEQHRKMLQ